MYRMSYPTYSDLELEIQQLEQENKKLKGLLKEHVTTYDVHFDELIEENKKLKERIRFLEQCLDNKEKVNKSLREELEKLKNQN